MIAITTFLNMGIISVRVASDIPVQSEYFPLISLYFFLSLLYTFVSFVWFVVANALRTKNYLPKFLNRLLSLTRFKLGKNEEDIVERKIQVLNFSAFTFILIVVLKWH